MRTCLQVQIAGNREFSRFSTLNLALDRPISRNIWGLGCIELAKLTGNFAGVSGIFATGTGNVCAYNRDPRGLI